MVEAYHISRWKILLAVLLLAGSTFIYLVFRPDNLIGFNLVGNIGLSGLLYRIRGAVEGIALPSFWVYSLPDGLWLISYLLLTDSLLPHHPTKPLWMLALPANAVVSEIAQYWHLLPGVFDIYDLLCYIVPTVLFVLFRNMNYTSVHFTFNQVQLAPLLLVSYLFLAGCSVEHLDTSFVITCAIHASILIVLSYGISMPFTTVRLRGTPPGAR